MSSHDDWICRHWRCLALAGLAALCFALSALATPRAQAASLFVVDVDARTDPNAQFITPTCNIVLTGVITVGDHVAMRATFEDFYKASSHGDSATLRTGNARAVLCLSSQGGDIHEAVKIADVFNDWMKVVEDGEECSSACAILFMAGSRRDGLFTFHEPQPGRYLHIRGRLGFHAPALQLPPGSTVDARQVGEAYARALDTIVSLVGRRFDTQDKQHSFAVSRFSEHILPAGLLLAFISVPPGGMYYVTRVVETMEWGIEIYGFPPPQAITQRMLQLGCMTLSALRCLCGCGVRCLNPDVEEMLILGIGADKAIMSTLSFDDPFDGFGWKRRIEKRSLWPPAGHVTDLSARGWSVDLAVAGGNYAQRKYCEARGIWHGRRLLSLEVDTFNGSFGVGLSADFVIPPEETVWPDPTKAFDVITVPGVEVLENRLRAAHHNPGLNHFRLWKLLPPGLLLTDLGDNPWSELEAGDDELGWSIDGKAPTPTTPVRP